MKLVRRTALVLVANLVLRCGPSFDQQIEKYRTHGEKLKLAPDPFYNSYLDPMGSVGDYQKLLSDVSEDKRWYAARKLFKYYVEQKDFESARELLANRNIDIVLGAIEGFKDVVVAPESETENILSNSQEVVEDLARLTGGRDENIKNSALEAILVYIKMGLDLGSSLKIIQNFGDAEKVCIIILKITEKAEYGNFVDLFPLLPEVLDAFYNRKNPKRINNLETEQLTKKTALAVIGACVQNEKTDAATLDILIKNLRDKNVNVRKDTLYLLDNLSAILTNSANLSQIISQIRKSCSDKETKEMALKLYRCLMEGLTDFSYNIRKDGKILEELGKGLLEKEVEIRRIAITTIKKLSDYYIKLDAILPYLEKAETDADQTVREIAEKLLEKCRVDYFCKEKLNIHKKTPL